MKPMNLLFSVTFSLILILIFKNRKYEETSFRAYTNYFDAADIRSGTVYA